MSTPSTPVPSSESASISIASNGSPFVFPRAYSFPPFFTRQHVATTHHAQCQKWASLILSYCRHHRLWKLSLIDAVSTDLFYNKKIEKRLALNDAREVVEFMRRDGRAEWIGNAKGAEEKNVAWIWWRNPEEWAGVIADWVGFPCQDLALLVRGTWRC
jgi:ESCRT-II complex subunit VPS25